MEKMIKAICEKLAEHSPFFDSEIYDQWLKYRSMDLIISAIEYCQSSGERNLDKAVRDIILMIEMGRGQPAAFFRGMPIFLDRSKATYQIHFEPPVR